MAFAFISGSGRGGTRRPTLGLLLAGVILLACGGAAAQEVPSSVDPGQIEKRFDVTPRQREGEAPEIVRPEAAPEAVSAAPEVFTLSDVKIEGVTVYGPGEFAPLYRDLLGKEVRLSDLEAVAKEITARYQRDGYVLSRAAAPQRKDGGTVVIRAIEGFIGQVAIEGEVKGDAALLEAYGDKITADRPTRIANLERYVLLISDLPGVTIRPLLEPIDEKAGAYKLILEMTQRSVTGFLQADNRGSNFIGPFQLWAGAGFNSLFGLYDFSRLRFITTPDAHELIFFDAAHTEPVGSEGTKVTVSGSYSTAAPGHTLERYDIRSRSIYGELQVTHPFVRSRHLDVYGTARFGYRNSVSDQQGVRAFEDRLRVLRAGTVVSFDDEADGRDWLSAEVSQGLGILGASRSNSRMTSRPGADSGFTKFTLDLSRYQRIAESWGVLVLAAGQAASGKLLAAEEFGLGGERIGRAYDAAEITGQDGLGTRLEIQRDFWPKDFPVTQVQLYGFYDIGAVWNGRRQSLSSAGGGVRAQLEHGVFAYVEVAKPLTRSVLGEGTEGKEPRLFFVVRADF